MRTIRSRSGWLCGSLVAVATLAAAWPAQGQTTKMPSTLRYGSGYIDVPVASVLPHLRLTGTFSGFNVDAPATTLTPAQSGWFYDGSFALGLFDRVEIGTTLQAFNDSNQGGNMWGAFGRLALLRPDPRGLGLAVGAQYVTAPGFDDNVDYQPPRLGFPDRRFRDTMANGEEIETTLTPYAVGSLFLPGADVSWLPEHDVTISAGYGNGMFNSGEHQSFYRYTDSDGAFGAIATHVQLGGSTLLNLMGEWNGLDLNFGAQLDLNGIRLGGHLLGANYRTAVGSYRSQKWGFLASACLNLSGDGGFLCGGELMSREPSDTFFVRLPAPPPDTVRLPAPPAIVRVDTVRVAPPLPQGTPTNICLATGEVVQVVVTAQGDTLVGPTRVSVRTLRPGIVFAGEYSENHNWPADQAVTFERRTYRKSGNELRLECPNIVRVGEFMGVPLFADRTATRPFQTLYVPVRPGIWQAYQTGLPATRGQ
jgi:hypothetical protein